MSLEHNNKIINDLDPNDFVYLEKDLDFYEKVTRRNILGSEILADS